MLGLCEYLGEIFPVVGRAYKCPVLNINNRHVSADGEENGKRRREGRSLSQSNLRIQRKSANNSIPLIQSIT